MDFSSLIGIIASIPKQIGSQMLEDGDFFFVKNPYFKGSNKLISILNNYSKVPTDKWITPQLTYVKVKQEKTFPVPCMDCPERKEIERIRLPTI